MKVPSPLIPSKSHIAIHSSSTVLPKFLHAPHHKAPSPPTPTQLNDLLNTASQTRNIRHVTQIHAQITTNGCISIPSLLNRLLSLYAKCGHVDQSVALFSQASDGSKNVVTWTSLITQQSHANKPFKALALFNQMRRTGIYPNHFTFSAVLPACAETMVLSHGEQIHCLVIKHGFGCDIFVGSALVDMYAKCSRMDAAQKMFDEMPERNLVTWNSMVVGLLQNKFFDRAVLVFREVLKRDAVAPDEVTFSSALSACGNNGGSEFGRQVHGLVVKRNLMISSYVKNSLLDMYCKCGSLDDALRQFRTSGVRDVVTWNVMMMGFVHNDKFEEACHYLSFMRSEDVIPDEVSFSTALHATASISALSQGTSIHNQILKSGFVSSTCIGSALIMMYAKCGSLADATRAFEEIKGRTVVCWSAMITAFQQHGCADQAIKMFEDMLAEGTKPDYITLVSLLSACSHAGRIDKGYLYFNSMSKIYGINPGHEHYACMVDLLGRAGRLDEAKKLTESMPIKADSTVWGALLGACSNHRNLELGREAADRLFELQPDNPGNYVLLSNMYSREGRSKEADEVRRLMSVNGLKKEPGCSWVDIKNTTFVFTSHDRSHTMTCEIYEMLGQLEELVKKKGYVPQVQFAVNSIGEYKERNLWHHSERLALAFALLTLPNGAPVRIKKNLRTCGDCHTVMKFASDIYKREIVVRDVNRFHRFTEGQCTCGDYW
ncbi:hypothetical protein EUGRSUZ_B01821 [Eucalyptus grandis]|uniref:DYW domain-containing protein n=2 Tax=Eucalyptus grandis TaxID=71139 RepID=A0A059D2Q4_EUCGR|nr:hypothetical protein EUGRSUZ_B01821 [Eucalyptus grandis]